MTDTNPFWEFSLSFYARDGVPSCCLALQAEYGVDVNVLLFCLWRASCGEAMTAATVGELDGSLADWRGDVVRPIRRLRQDLKFYPGIESTRTLLKQAELESERVQQCDMWRWQSRRPEAEPVGVDVALRANLDAYAVLLGVEPSSFSAVEELAHDALVSG